MNVAQNLPDVVQQPQAPDQEIVQNADLNNNIQTVWYFYDWQTGIWGQSITQNQNLFGQLQVEVNILQNLQPV